MQGSGGTLRQTDPPSPVSPNHQQPFAVEICCGQASLSRELINVGFSVLAVDHVMHDPQVPVSLLALTQASHQKILIDLLHNRPPDYIHLGMGSLLAYVQAQNKLILQNFWHSLTEIFFHNCCHGGQRKKGTRWKSAPGVFTQLTAHCQNDHNHLRYQVQSQNGTGHSTYLRRLPTHNC